MPIQPEFYTVPNVPAIPPMKIHIPERVWTLYPCNGTYFKIELPHAPNKFHRMMQSIFLGFRYERIKK